MWCRWIVILAFFTLAVDCKAAGKNDRIIVATYNVQLAHNAELTLKNLKSFNADIICLQEIDKEASSLRMLADKLGMKYVFAGYSDRSRVGCAIMARGNVVRVTTLKMPRERNFGLVADVIVKGKSIRVICVHLKSLPRPLIHGAFKSMLPRMKQAKTVVQYALKSRKPVIVAGDTNSLAIFPGYATLAQSLKDSCTVKKTTTQPSIFVNKIGYRIDHVFVKGPWEIISSKVLPLSGSDHRPVVATLRLKKPTTQPAAD